MQLTFVQSPPTAWLSGIVRLVLVYRDRGNLCDTRRMHPTTADSSYKGRRFPHEIISHAVWLYFRFSLSYRDVEALLAERGIVVTYETIRQWCR